jgi:hypothetical protein
MLSCIYNAKSPVHTHILRVFAWFWKMLCLKSDKSRSRSREQKSKYLQLPHWWCAIWDIVGTKFWARAVRRGGHSARNDPGPQIDNVQEFSNWLEFIWLTHLKSPPSTPESGHIRIAFLFATVIMLQRPKYFLGFPKI